MASVSDYERMKADAEKWRRAEAFIENALNRLEHERDAIYANGGVPVAEEAKIDTMLDVLTVVKMESEAE